MNTRENKESNQTKREGWTNRRGSYQTKPFTKKVNMAEEESEEETDQEVKHNEGSDDGSAEEVVVAEEQNFH